MRLVTTLLLASACAGVPLAPPHAWVPPPAGPRAEVEVCWVDTGGLSTSAGNGTGGAPKAKTWEVTSAALVVRHPRGTVLIDTGISPTAADDARELGGWRRFVFDQTAGRNQPRRALGASLTALGVTTLTAVVLSHAHADHAGGLTALPDVPVWLAEPERALVVDELAEARGVVVPAHARAMASRMVALPFVQQPWANYDQHFDVFGDGSLVVVPAFGHTPGSVVTFVTTASGRRLAHVGDLVNLRESLEQRVGKSWLMRTLTDEDDAATQAQVGKLVQLHEADPALVILPAHDRPAFVELFGEDAGALPPCIR